MAVGIWENTGILSLHPGTNSLFGFPHQLVLTDCRPRVHAQVTAARRASVSDMDWSLKSVIPVKLCQYPRLIYPSRDNTDSSCDNLFVMFLLYKALKCVEAARNATL